MALKYPNKRKRKGYWPRYERASIKDHRKVWNFINEIINEIGLPFKKSRLGRNPKLDIKLYAKIIVYLFYFGIDLREAQDELERFEGKTINFTNIDRWLWKVNEEWIRQAVQLLHYKIESMFRKGEYISDASSVTTNNYYETTRLDSEGKPILDKLCMKLHVFVTYFFTIGLVSIANFHVTHGDASENPVLHENLLENVKVRKGRRHHADKGFWSKLNILKTRMLGLKPNIVPKNKSEKGLVIKKAIQEYDNEARKKYRGLVEAVFGGLTTGQGMKTRYRKDCARRVHVGFLALTHEMRTYFRALANKTLSYLLLFMQQPPSEGNGYKPFFKKRPHRDSAPEPYETLEFQTVRWDLQLLEP